MVCAADTKLDPSILDDTKFCLVVSRQDRYGVEQLRIAAFHCPLLNAFASVTLLVLASAAFGVVVGVIGVYRGKIARMEARIGRWHVTLEGWTRRRPP